jgi:hypothetical protein
MALYDAQTHFGRACDSEVARLGRKPGESRPDIPLLAEFCVHSLSTDQCNPVTNEMHLASSSYQEKPCVPRVIHPETLGA